MGIDSFLYIPAKPGFSLFSPDFHFFIISSRHISLFKNTVSSKNESSVNMEFTKIIQMEQNSIRNLFSVAISQRLFALLNSSNEFFWIFYESDPSEAISRLVLGPSGLDSGSRKRLLETVLEYFSAVRSWNEEAANYCRLELKCFLKIKRKEEIREVLELNSQEERARARKAIEKLIFKYGKGTMQSAQVIFHFKKEKSVESKAVFWFLGLCSSKSSKKEKNSPFSASPYLSDPNWLEITSHLELHYILNNKQNQVSLVLDTPKDHLDDIRAPSTLVSGLSMLQKTLKTYKNSSESFSVLEKSKMELALLDSVAQKSSKIKWEVHPFFSPELRFNYDNVKSSLFDSLTSNFLTKR